MANDPNHGAGPNDEPDDWTDVLESLTDRPAAATSPSNRPEVTGVRIRTPELEAAVTGAPAPVTNRPVVPHPADDDSLEGARTSAMPAITQRQLVELQQKLGRDGHLPTLADETLPPGEQPVGDGVVRSQGIPGDSTHRSPPEERPTIPGTGTPSAPTIGRPVVFRAATPALGVTSHPSYRGPIVTAERTRPEDALDTVRPPRNEYGPTVREFRSDSQRDALGRPDHEVPPPHDEHAEEDGQHAEVIIPYSDVPSTGLKALFRDELLHGEPLEPDTDRDVDTAVTGPTPQPAPPERTRWIEQGQWLLAWSLIWLFSLSQRTRRLLLGVATLALVILGAAAYHLVDNWWYYNPF